MTYLAFILGLWVGAFLGVLITSMAQISKTEEPR